MLLLILSLSFCNFFCSANAFFCYVHVAHSHCSFSLFLSAAIFPHYSFFFYIPFLSHTLNCSLSSLLLAIRFHWSFLFCSCHSHLPIFSFTFSFTLSWRVLLFSLSLLRSRSSCFSFFPCVHYCGGTLQFIVSSSLSYSCFQLFPCAHLSTHVEYFLFFFFLYPIIFFFYMDRRFIPLVL